VAYPFIAFDAHRVLPISGGDCRTQTHPTLSGQLLPHHPNECIFAAMQHKETARLYFKLIIFMTGEIPMKYANIIITVALTLLSSLFPAQAQNHPATGTAAPESKDRCQAEVLKFEHIMSFIRESQGPQAAAKLKEKLLPAKTESEIMSKDGYCGLARHLREKKLTS
jgi:hypothetical protein